MKHSINTTLNRTVALLLGAAPFLALPVNADDIEIYTGATGGGFEEQIRPNILYVVDTSGSMKGNPGFFISPADWWGAPYDPTVTYPGSCDASKVYRVSEDDDPSGNQYVGTHGYPIDAPANPADITAAEDADIRFQSCDNQYHFPLADMVCDQALQAFNDPDRGWYKDHWAEQIDMDGSDRDWQSLSSSDNTSSGWRECAGDYGSHGETDSSTLRYPAKNPDGWTNSTADSDLYDSILDNSEYIVAPGNFLNWFYAVSQSRIGAVKVALRDIVRDLPPETVIGLMIFDSGEDGSTGGGMIIKEFVKVGENNNRQDFIDVIKAIPNETTGPTPLGETLMEAAYAFGGKRVYFGTDTANDAGDDFPSVPESRLSSDSGSSDYAFYKSPIEASCQSNNIIFLSDGAPTADSSAWPGSSSIDSKAGFAGGFENLPGYENYASTDCDDGCLEHIANYLANEDMNSNVSGVQTIKTSTIGFGSDLGNSDQDFLRRTATNGQGTFVMANSFDELKDAFKVTTRKAVTANTAFAAPALAVNAFNRTQDGNRVYFALFKSSTEPGWRGNLKAYELARDETSGDIIIVDRDGNPAVDPDTGLFHFDARSFWSEEADGNQAPDGGAASNIDVSTRNIYSWFGSETNKALVNPDYIFASYNSDITDTMLGMDGSEPAGYRNEIFQWMNGINPADSTERLHMGDPLHSRPVVVRYGTTETSPQQKIFVTTNDGMLHIINAESGLEEFAFMAEESIKNAKRIYSGDASEGKAYGMDGALQVWIDEGAEYTPGIEAGETVYLYAPMRRGGRSLYAFDMTNPASPKILWRIQGGDIDGDGSNNDEYYYLGQTWSSPQFGKLRIGGSERKVLIFGGGYDPKQDDPDGSSGTDKDAYIDDDMGNAIYIVDARTGDRLWWAGGPGSGADLVIDEMKNSIPSDVAVIDVDNDSWTDRLYVGDTGGRIFRIDVNEFNAGGTVTATGGMIADVGGSSKSTAHPDNVTIPHNRKFFYAPDIVTVENGDDDYLAIAIGSGNRAHPSYPIAPDPETNDMFFVFKDPNILTIPSSYDYDINMEPVTSTNPNGLYDATNNDVMSSDPDTRDDALNDMADAKGGWYIELIREGEKALAPAVTLNYKTYFTTFEPLDLDLSTCQARTGIGRLYALDIRTGKPVNANFANDEDVLETEDRAYELKRDGIAPAMVFTFPEADDGKPNGMTGPELPPANFGSNAKRSYWRAE